MKTNWILLMVGLFTAASAHSAKPVELVMMGDSITEFWLEQDRDFFKEGWIDHGVSGETTRQMLRRFEEDVLSLHPVMVHILGGTNDIAGNDGPFDLQRTENHLREMVQIARANGIKVILGAIPPASGFYWNPFVRPIRKIKALNQWIEEYAYLAGVIHVDYFSALDDGFGGMKKEFSDDGVHPNLAGYRAMEPLMRAAVREAF